MSREDCEKTLTLLMEIAYRTYRAYNPNGTRLSMFFIGDYVNITDYAEINVTQFEFTGEKVNE